MMTEPAASTPVRAGAHPAVITGVAAVSALGRSAEALLAGALAGEPAFAPVRRFDVSSRRVGIAATLPGTPVLADELARVVDDACADAGLSAADRAASSLLLAVHGDPTLARAPAAEQPQHSAEAMAQQLARACAISGPVRAYTSACVAASTAVADAAAAIGFGRAQRVVVAAGYVVEPDQFALFDAGRALATDQQVRPFSTGRTGLLLGDGVAAMVVESVSVARARGARVLARLAGWGRAGDAYHVVQPRPDGAGLARAIRDAMQRARVTADEIGYINAHGSGTPQSDVAEAAGVHAALGAAASRVPISSTKSVHGQALEASGLLELIITVLALRVGQLPVNAGFLGADPQCPLNVIAEGPHPATPRYALSLNSAFGGAHTALLIEAVS